MPKKTVGQLKTEIKEAYLNKIIDLFAGDGEDVAKIANNRINIPYVDSEGNEGWIEIPVIIPTKNEGAPYDGYELREAYELNCQERAMERELAEQRKKEKAEEMKKKREEQKRKREAEKQKMENRKAEVEAYFNE